MKNVKHEKFCYSYAMQLANDSIDLLYGLKVTYGYSFEDFWNDCKDDLVAKLVKPDKYTILHSFIEYAESLSEIDIDLDLDCMEYPAIESYFDYLEAMIKGSGYEVLESRPNLEIVYNCHRCGECAECEQLIPYTKSLIAQMSAALPTAINTAFHLLMFNKTFLRDFHVELANHVKQDLPYLLRKHPVGFANNQIKRNSYWPSWLKRGIFHRDKGVCVVCRTDLSGTLNLGLNFEVDHIVPISKFGCNDPSNLQILCNQCNLQKLNKNNLTSCYEIPLWNLD